jgi:hypothetical protein
MMSMDACAPLSLGVVMPPQGMCCVMGNSAVTNAVHVCAEDNMRQVITTTMLIVGAVITLLSFPAQAQYAVCIPARGCAPATQASYNACYQLALRRGWNESDNVARDIGGRALDFFIYQCLLGKIPR